MSKTTNFSPLQTALQQAQAQSLNANAAGQQAAVTGLNTQANTLNSGLAAATAYQTPYINNGTTASNTAAGIAGADTPAQYAALMQNPELLAIQANTQRLSNQNAAATGMTLSTGQQNNLNTLMANNTAQYLNQVFNQNATLAGQGQQAGTTASDLTYGTTNQLGNVQANIGNVNANADLSAGQIQANTSLNSGLASVAQSTIAGLQNGQLAGLQSSAPVTAADSDPFGTNTAAQQAFNGTTGTTGSSGITSAGGGGAGTSSSGGGTGMTGGGTMDIGSTTAPGTLGSSAGSIGSNLTGSSATANLTGTPSIGMSSGAGLAGSSITGSTGLNTSDTELSPTGTNSSTTGLNTTGTGLDVNSTSPNGQTLGTAQAPSVGAVMSSGMQVNGQPVALGTAPNGQEGIYNSAGQLQGYVPQNTASDPNARANYLQSLMGGSGSGMAAASQPLPGLGGANYQSYMGVSVPSAT